MLGLHSSSSGYNESFSPIGLLTNDCEDLPAWNYPENMHRSVGIKKCFGISIGTYVGIKYIDILTIGKEVLGEG